ncbi:DUF805 domain-containing protein [Wenyingzhuangia marina]|uniref:Uncharacterized membrane protein YhaH, DUF805 family n=1 Tax=Wenyingzhuangia marina TaxID=1195760 RepID=A0A1M5TCQ1_9FLAO|nr:DUF805 domain-containing protein [Wenyingzhuangia marina]SHH48498.1 Uncharacterized membrane protein YhaH, DUF805 family [Wenyingzhuangia marina]
MRKYYLVPFKKMFDFKGTSTLNEFWVFYGINLLIYVAIVFLRKPLGIPMYTNKVFLGMVAIPHIAIGFRRLRDAGINSWLFLIPSVNLILAGLPSIKKVQ